jgi:hypothetical protein
MRDVACVIVVGHCRTGLVGEKSSCGQIFFIGHFDIVQGSRPVTRNDWFRQWFTHRREIEKEKKGKKKKKTVTNPFAAAIAPPSPPGVIRQIAARQCSCLCRIASLEGHVQA